MNVDHEINGLITDINAPHTFKEAMERLYHDQALRFKLKEHSVKASKTKSWPRVFNDLINVYQTLI